MIANPPVAIVDAAVANYQFWGKYPMSGRPELRKFVDANYRDIGNFDGFQVYLNNEALAPGVEDATE